MIDLTDFICAAMVVLGAMITRYVIPWIKGKLTADKAAQLAEWAKIAVQAAEELARGGQLDKTNKYAYVMQSLRAHGWDLDADTMKTVIDGTVWELINQFKQESEAAQNG